MSEEKSKGFSLRKKATRRLPISSPQQIPNSGPKAPALALRGSHDAPHVNGSSKANLAPPRDRTRPGGNTSDLVKRRYSTRFTQLPDFSNEGTPPVPHLPSAANQANRYGQSLVASGPSHGITVDINALGDPNLHAEKYIASLLSDASDQEIRDFQANLRKTKNRTSTDLQRNVYQNRTQFIKISREAEKLKSEMNTLKGLMLELKTCLDQALVSSSSLGPGLRSTTDMNGPTRATKAANRSSVANLEALWTAHLQSLWKSVEGSQKFLPAIQGRHVVHESGHWSELDAATWKTRRSVHIFLLNDQLMVATKKKNRVDPNAAINGKEHQKDPTRLVAERCWPLQDIDIIDIGTNDHATNGHVQRKRDIANAIYVRYGQESFTYRCDRSDSNEKSTLLLEFRRTADELRKVQRAGTEELPRNRKSVNYFAARDAATAEKSDLLASLKNSQDRPEILIDVDGKQKNLRWVEEQIDELDIEVALQRFEDAVRHVEKLRKLSKSLRGNVIMQDLIITKMDQRAAKLADMVIQRLFDTHSFANATQENVAWLVRLGFEDRAREAYLTARTDVIVKRVRQCIFEGDLQQYIFQVSFVYFTIIRNTVGIYQHCFPPFLMSACVRWAKEHLDGFNQVLSRQLSGVQRDSHVWKECMDRAREHATMMNEVGLNFKELIGVEVAP